MPNLYDKVAKILKETIRPAVQMDGGDVELVSVDEKTGVVKVRFQGACVGCPMSSITLHAGIAHQLKTLLPEITSVEEVDDCACDHDDAV
jgi:Fe-S cluster biogenesis protein NfuA